MGVDYKANFGIGYEININDKPDPDEYIEELFNNEPNLKEDFYYLQSGDEYCNEINFYIVLKNPNDKLNDLTKYKLKLEILLKKHNIQTINDFGLVGGLYIY